MLPNFEYFSPSEMKRIQKKSGSNSELQMIKDSHRIKPKKISNKVLRQERALSRK